MIYICKGCGEICKAPCKACDEVCKGCSQCWDPILKGPLGCYVMATWCCMLLAGGCGAAGAMSAGCTDAQMMCAIAVGMALLHAGFAYYLQRRIINGIQSKLGGMPNNAKDIATEAGQIVLYDIGFCLYVFAFFGCFGLCFYGFSLLSCGGGLGYAALGLLIFFHMVAPAYGMCWYCGQCCFANIGPGGPGGRAGGPLPQTMGARS